MVGKIAQVVLLMLLVTFVGCGKVDKVIGVSQVSNIIFGIQKDDLGGSDKAVVGFLGYMDDGAVVTLIFMMPPAVVLEGYENSGNWMNDHFVSLVSIVFGDERSVYEPFGDVRFKVLKRTDSEMVFSISGRYVDPLKNQYVSVESMTGTWSGNAVKDAVDISTLQAP